MPRALLRTTSSASMYSGPVEDVGRAEAGGHAARRRLDPRPRPTPSAKPMSTQRVDVLDGVRRPRGPGDQVVAGHVGPLVDGADRELRRSTPSANVMGTTVAERQPWSSATDRDTASCVGAQRRRRRRPARRGRARPLERGRLDHADLAAAAVDQGDAGAEPDRGVDLGQRPRCRWPGAGLSPPPPNWPPLMTRSPVTDCVTLSSTDALSEAANTVNRVTTPTPTSAPPPCPTCAGGCAWRCAGQHAGDPTQPGQRRADGGAGRTGHHRAGDDHAHERGHGAQAGERRGCRRHRGSRARTMPTPTAASTAPTTARTTRRPGAVDRDLAQGGQRRHPRRLHAGARPATTVTTHAR